MRFPLHSWKLPLLSVAFLALLVAFLNPSDPGITSPDIEYVQRVVDGDTLDATPHVKSGIFTVVV